MTGVTTNYARGKLATVFPRGQALGGPSVWYLALATAVSDAAAGSFTEATGAGYARAQIDASLAAWTGSNGNSANAATVAFPAPSGDWSSGANMTHVVLMDASSGGNAWEVFTLATPQPVLNGQAAPSFAASALVLNVGAGT